MDRPSSKIVRTRPDMEKVHVQRVTHPQGHHPYDTFRIAVGGAGSQGTDTELLYRSACHNTSNFPQITGNILLSLISLDYIPGSGITPVLSLATCYKQSQWLLRNVKWDLCEVAEDPPTTHGRFRPSWGSSADQNSFRSVERMNTRRPLRVGSRSSTTTSSHWPNRQNLNQNIPQYGKNPSALDRLESKDWPKGTTLETEASGGNQGEKACSHLISHKG
ncbi:hypothetical protein T265_11347 [Opisthorchis viverrini]|uniref:Uncharacterized protein n=1 Tax=Opisthorchis viverrini TaxID=6198 RepID=A0A074Z3B5_OPIVI|nr:hypothetical protein T265_11347 [Opisthorchis viverrini]KER20012.1 hypothetical protein T265_11347 [Opisthorchis viverrini]